MILDLRTYDFAPGDALRYLGVFGPEGLPLISAHLSLVGYWMSEVGALNRLRHLYVYDDLDDRTRRRAGMLADERWTKGFLPQGMALIRRQAVVEQVHQHGLAAPHAAPDIEPALQRRRGLAQAL